MIERLNRLLRVQRGEWPRLVQFGLFGFLLQAGLGIGFSAGDAAFLSHVGAQYLPLVFMTTPLVMVFYTALFTFLLVRSSIDRMVDVTLAGLVFGGTAFALLIRLDLPEAWQGPLYFILKLYVAMWYIALYSLFWNYTDAYFDIQDAKRLFPLFAAFCALGTATGALFVGLSAEETPLWIFFLAWALVAAITHPLARWLRRRWKQIKEDDDVLDDEVTGPINQLAAVARAFTKSRYTIVLTATLFVTLLLTNLAEFQYSTVLQVGRSEADLAALFGALHVAANLFNLVMCLFLFNRLVGRFGVRNIAFVQPLIYFSVFGWLFLAGGTGAAFAAFFAYHSVLTSVEYNNQNLLFNAVPSRVKRPLRALIEGLAEPLASLVAGGFLLFAATRLGMRQLSGVALIVAAGLVAIVILLRQFYPAAMTANMRQGWLNFSAFDPKKQRFDGAARTLLERAAQAGAEDRTARLATRLLEMASEPPLRLATTHGSDVPAALLRQVQDDTRGAHETRYATPRPQPADGIFATARDGLPRLVREERSKAFEFIGKLCDTKSVDEMLAGSAALEPRDRRTMASSIIAIGETAIPRLIRAVGNRTLAYPSRVVAGHALARLSYAQFAIQVDRQVSEAIGVATGLHSNAATLDRYNTFHPWLPLLARAQRERAGAALDFALEFLAIGGRLPNFDLLIVSLHSNNAKVRANAIETIENGIGGAHFRLIAPLLHRSDSDARVARDLGLVAALETALESDQAIEMTLAADILHAHQTSDAFIRQMQRIIKSTMPDLFRCRLLKLTGIAGEDDAIVIDQLAALAASELVGSASLASLLVLAGTLEKQRPIDPVLQISAANTAYWVSRRNLEDVASCFADLALVLLKSSDDRQYAL